MAPGMSMFNERLLTQCFSDHQKKFGGLKEDYFAVLYLAKRFGLSQEEALKWVTFGGFDYGIGAYYVDAAAGNLYVYQFKWSVSVVQMGQSIDRLVDNGIDAIFGTQPAELRRNDIINRLRADVRERQSEIRRVFFFFISNGTMPGRGENAVLDSRLEDLERVSVGKLRSFFKTDVEIIIRVNEDAAPPPQFRFPLKWTGSSDYKLETGESLSLGFASLVDLATMYEKMGLRLFQKNIRAGLTWDTPPNRALKTTFQEIASGKTSAKAFVFRHNGVSIEVSAFTDNGQTAELTEPRILNGAQTIVTLHRLIFPEKGNPPEPTEIERLSHIRVLAKIIFGSSEQFVTDVTIANNKQNPVKPWNLRASDRYQIDLEQRFKEEVRLAVALSERSARE
jgi:AIPR protein